MAASQTEPVVARIVAMASSAGGLQALQQVLSGLPVEFPAAIVIVQHIMPRHQSHLAKILSRHCVLPVRDAVAGDRLMPGSVFLAPPDRHLMVEQDGTLSLSQGERVHFVRPSADVLFESVAATFGERAVAVVLTGSGSDGATGVRSIKRMGGTVIVQDQASSAHFGMPGSAIDTGIVDLVLPLSEIAGALVTLIKRDSKA